jgi:hypothetical protein
MRWVVTLLFAVTANPAYSEASINGVWVLNQRLSSFANPSIPEKVVMEANSTAPGWVSVFEIRTDARGQHIQSERYSIRAANAVPVGQDTTRAPISRFLLRSQGTGIVEEWGVEPNGLLLVRRPLPTGVRTNYERLVFQRAERRGLEVVK